MEIINGERRSGRTVELILESAKTGRPILTPSIQQAAFVEAEARKMGLEIPKPHSFSQVVEMRERGFRGTRPSDGYFDEREIDRRGGYLIDNADALLEGLLFEKLGARVAAVTICAPVAMKERYREKLEEAAEVGEGPGGLRIVEVDEMGLDLGGEDQEMGGVQYYCRACRRITTTYRYKHTSGGKVIMECPACGELTVLPEKRGDNHGY